MCEFQGFRLTNDWYPFYLPFQRDVTDLETIFQNVLPQKPSKFLSAKLLLAALRFSGSS